MFSSRNPCSTFSTPFSSSTQPAAQSLFIHPVTYYHSSCLLPHLHFFSCLNGRFFISLDSPSLFSPLSLSSPFLPSVFTVFFLFSLQLSLSLIFKYLSISVSKALLALNHTCTGILFIKILVYLSFFGNYINSNTNLNY